MNKALFRLMGAIVLSIILAISLLTAGTVPVKATQTIVNKTVEDLSAVETEVNDNSITLDAPSLALTEGSVAPTVSTDYLTIIESSATTPIKPLALGFIVLLGLFVSVTVYMEKKSFK